MRMMQLDDLVVRVRERVPAAPIPLAERHIIDKATVLCERIPAWRDNDEITFGPNQPDEYVCTIPYANLDRIETAYFEDISLEAVTPGYLDVRYPNWDNGAGEVNTPRYVTQLSTDTVRIYPVQPGKLRLRMVLKPDAEATLLPDSIIRQYGRELAIGAAGEIMLLPDVEYQNPQLGSALLSRFASWLDKEAVKTSKTQLRVPKRSIPSYL